MAEFEGAHPIIFYDGQCPLCSWWVGLVSRFDREGIFRYAPLQGKTAQQLVSRDLTQSMDTLVLWDKGVVRIKSEACCYIADSLPIPWRCFGFLRVVPAFFRDGLYDLVARVRPRRNEYCQLNAAIGERLLP